MNKVRIGGEEFEQAEIFPETWDEYVKKPVKVKALQIHSDFEVETLEGVMTGRKGDWLIEGVNGEFYPCKPDIFEKTYERVDEGSK